MRWVCLAMLTACGRIGFEPIAANGDAPIDGPSAFGVHASAGAQVGIALAIAGDGMIAMAGGFETSLDLAPPLTSRGGLDGFVSFLGPSGEVRWSRQLGGSGEDWVRAVAIDGADNLYVAGEFSATVDFGGGPLVASGEEDVFVASFDRDGAHRWSRRLGGNAATSPYGSDRGLAIAVTPSGEVYAGGQVMGTVDLGLGPTAQQSAGFDAFVLALDAAGGPRWAMRYGAGTNTKVTGLAVDPAGVYATGYFEGSQTFGGATPRVSQGQPDLFVASYTPAGGFRWSNAVLGPGTEWGRAITVDPSGQVYLVGTFTSTATFPDTTVEATSVLDAFVLALDAGGNERWHRRSNATCAKGLGIVATADRVYTAGVFESTMMPGSTPVSSDGPEDAYVASYDLAGGLQDVQRVGGSTSDAARALALDATGRVVIVGGANTADQCRDTAGTYGEEDLWLTTVP